MSGNPFGEDENTAKNPFDTSYARSGGDLTFATPQNRTLASQQRALASISHSEQVGVSTLEELAEQREKLDRAEKRLHEIGELQKDSHKQIGALQSWWKSWFTKKSNTPIEPVNKESPPQITNQPVHAASFLSRNGNSISSSMQQPTLKLSSQNHPSSQFCANMDMMSSGISRLKSMATVMNAELKAQNQQLDRMDPQLAKVSDTMTTQNRQMNKLLGVKNPP